MMISCGLYVDVMVILRVFFVILCGFHGDFMVVYVDSMVIFVVILL